MNDCKLQAQAQFSWEASLPASFEDCRLQSADTSEYLGIRTRPFRCCCLGHVFGTAAASFGSVVITKRKLKTNGYALHIKQLLFAAQFFFYFVFFRWLLHCFLGFFVSWAKNKLCDRCDNDSRRRRRTGSNTEMHLWARRESSTLQEDIIQFPKLHSL